ncbi:MAG: glutathione S-transferase family protein [Candidatus Binatus sp.]|uniref:glutathione S-transferase family protein n=1 Tax=Candidatus Binatus sp. TaxID=2811406 RepID=UPI0027245BBB|nr:glutathione S-transferase family protein [Candidatus Binatus sp.]MDO8431674.1 glutathione S-transferase family protein [Candidatus Binatus sp.]
MIKLYGTSMSRAARCLWALEELNLKYEHIPVSFPGYPVTPASPTRQPDFLKINPNGHIPALDDDGQIFSESMAINLYLAEKYGQGSRWPKSIEDRAATYQWSFWGMCEVEPHLGTLLMHRIFFAPELRDENAAIAAAEALKAPFKVLDDHLQGREYILGNDFTIADLNVASILNLAMLMSVGLASTPALRRWLEKCLARDANQKTRNMR